MPDILTNLGGVGDGLAKNTARKRVAFVYYK